LVKFPLGNLQGGLAMEKVLLAGADVHQQNIRVRYGVGMDEPVGESFGGKKKGRAYLVTYLRKEAARVGAKRIVVAYEASSVGYVLRDELEDGGIECYVLAPTKIKTSSQDRKKKTDDKDALRIHEALKNHILAGSKLPAVWIPDQETRDAREVVRCRADWGHKLTAVKCEIQSLLKRHGLEKPEEFESNWTQKHRVWVKRWTEGKSPLHEGARQVLKSLLRQLEFLEGEALVLDQAVVKKSQLPRYRKAVDALDAMAGIRVLTAMVFLTELGDMSRFQNRRQVGSIMGLAPSSNESGEITDRKGHITRFGSSRLRRALCQSVWSRIREGREDWPFYDRLVSRNPKKKMIAVVACMRKLGIKMWHVASAAAKESA
jgi:transposase